jgi:glycosyltransferase involved in cell wall biosynthesis
MPAVSVVVPSYNYAEYIGKCIESILGQRGFSDFELIVVDDASVDGSQEVIRSFDDPRLTLVCHEENQGHIRTINEGFRRSTGRYLVHVGSDDYWDPDFLSSTVRVLEEHPEVGLVHTNYAMVEADGTIASPRAENIPFTGDFKGSELRWLLFENYFPPHGTLFRRSGLELIGGSYSEELPYSEDWRLWLAIGSRSPTYFLDHVLAYYRCHDRNLHTRVLKSGLGEKVEIGILDEFFSRPGLDDEVRELRDQVYAAQYRRYADNYFGIGQMRQCRRCLHIALRHRPSIILERPFLRRYAASLLPLSVHHAVRAASTSGKSFPISG